MKDFFAAHFVVFDSSPFSSEALFFHPVRIFSLSPYNLSINSAPAAKHELITTL